MIGFFDPMYLILVALPAGLLAGWATLKVRTTMAAASRVPASSGLTGAQAAARILEANGIHDVSIEPTRGMLGDHYDPRSKALRLTPEVYQGRSLTAVGVAAHEAGHALQHAHSYGPLALRNGLVPLASLGSNLSYGILFLGFILGSMNLILAGIVAFSLVVITQLVNLPVEFDASSRAKALLIQNGVITGPELAPVSRVLSAAAMTYVAATLTAVLTLVYYLFRSGLLGGRSDD